VGSIRKNKRAENPPCNSDPIISGKSLKVRLKTLKKVHWILIVKWIYSKYVYEEKGLIPLEEYLVLLEVNERLNKSSWVGSRSLTKNELSIRFSIDFLLRESERSDFGISPSKSSYKELLLDRFSYYGFYHNNLYPERLFSVFFTSNVSETRKISKRYIGVGYKDKGFQPPVHKKEPHWTEICMHILYQQDSPRRVSHSKREIRVLKRKPEEDS